MLMPDKLIFLGVISAAYGIKGEVVVKTFNADPKTLSEMNLVDKDGKLIDLQFVRMHPKGGIVAKIAGCNTRSAAENLAKTKIYCHRDSLSEPEEDEFYIADLVGMKVVNTAGEEIGLVSAVHNFGAGDIIEVEFTAEDKQGKKEMFPFNKEFFPEINKTEIIADL